MATNNIDHDDERRIVSLYITNKEHAALKYCAYRRFRTVNSLIREIMGDYIAVHVPEEEIKRAYELVKQENRGKHTRRKNKALALSEE